MSNVEVLLLSLLLLLGLYPHLCSAIKWVRNRRVPPSQLSPKPKPMDLESQAHQLLLWEQKLQAWEQSLQERQTPSKPSRQRQPRASERSWMEL